MRDGPNNRCEGDCSLLQRSFFKTLTHERYKPNVLFLDGKKHTTERQKLKVIESSSETEVDGPLSHSSSSSLGGTRSKWETLVVVAVNLSRLDMSTNMGSVMGQTQ